MKKFFKEIQMTAEEFDNCAKSLNMQKIGEKGNDEYYTYISKKTGKNIFAEVKFGLDFDYTSMVDITLCILGDRINVKEEIKKPELTTEELFEYIQDFENKNKKYDIQRREDFILENGVKLYKYEDDIYEDKNNSNIIYRAIKNKENKIYTFQEIENLEENEKTKEDEESEEDEI